MLDKIDDSDISIQIETGSEDLWIPNGLAISQGDKNRRLPGPPMVHWNPGPLMNTPMQVQYRVNGKIDHVVNRISNWTTPTDLPDWGEYDPETGKITILRRVTFDMTANLSTTGFAPNVFSSYQGGVGFEHFSSTGARRNQYLNQIHQNFPVGTVDRPPRVRRINAYEGDVIWFMAWLMPDYKTFYQKPIVNSLSLSFKELDPTVAIRPEWYVFAGDQVTKDDNGGFKSTHSYSSSGKAKIAEAIFTSTVRRVTPSVWVTGHWTGNGNNTWETGHYTDGATEIDEYIIASIEARGQAQGPIIIQSRVPTPVNPGDKYSITGDFRVRKPGGTMKTDAGAETGIAIRASLWGIGIVSDAYGIDNLRPIELQFYQATLSGPSDNTSATVKFTFPTIPAATIPDGVTGVYFSVSYVQEATGEYTAVTNLERSNKSSSSKTGNTTTSRTSKPPAVFLYDPLSDTGFRVVHTPRDEASLPYYHPLSPTGAAYRGNKVFNNVRAGAEITAWGNGTTATISVFNYSDGVRGSLISSFTAPSDTKTVHTINPTGTSIEIVSSQDFFIESVINAATGNTLSYVKNQIERVNYASIVDDISKVSIIREEGEYGSLTIDFCSSTLDPTTSDILKIGKRLRVLGRHFGNASKTRPPGWVGDAAHDEIFTGTIRSINTEFDYVLDEPIIQVIVYDVQFNMDMYRDTGSYIDFASYAPFLNKLGVDAIYNNHNYGGARGVMPNKGLYWPMALGESLTDSLRFTRNRNKGYFYVNRKNQIVLMDRESDEEPFVLTDGTLPGDANYGNMKRSLDTESMVNQVTVTEHRIDWTDFMKRSIKQGEAPPQNFQYPKEETQVATFKDAESIEIYGEYSRDFHVVRGTGDITDVYAGQYGSGFEDWALSIIEDFSDPVPRINKVTVPVKSSLDIWVVSNIDLLTPVDIVYKGVVQHSKVRAIEMEIRPGKWTVTLEFESKEHRTFW